MRWQLLLLTAISLTVALSLGSCGLPSGMGQGIKDGEMMQGAIGLNKAIELDKAIKLPRGRGVTSRMEREISPLGEEARATKIKDKIKELNDRLLEEAWDNGPDALEAYKQNYDSDLDGRFDGQDNCPDVLNMFQQDSDRDGIGDVCDSDMYPYVDVDADRDSVLNDFDNCDYISNWDQEDLDGADGGDACDSDMDGDGFANVSDPDMDGDRYDYTSDPDNDGDGVVNAYDRFDWLPAYY